MIRYAILDASSARGADLSLAIVEAPTPLAALSEYCDLEGIARYDALEPDELAEATYELDGLLGAPFTNYEIIAYPIAGELELVGPGPAGYALRDAAGTYVADDLELEVAREIIGGGVWWQP